MGRSFSKRFQNDSGHPHQEGAQDPGRAPCNNLLKSLLWPATLLQIERLQDPGGTWTYIVTTFLHSRFYTASLSLCHQPQHTKAPAGVSYSGLSSLTPALSLGCPMKCSRLFTTRIWQQTQPMSKRVIHEGGCSSHPSRTALFASSLKNSHSTSNLL